MARGGCRGDGLVAGGSGRGTCGAVVIGSREDGLEFLTELKEEEKAGRD